MDNWLSTRTHRALHLCRIFGCKFNSNNQPWGFEDARERLVQPWLKSVQIKSNDAHIWPNHTQAVHFCSSCTHISSCCVLRAFQPWCKLKISTLQNILRLYSFFLISLFELSKSWEEIWKTIILKQARDRRWIFRFSITNKPYRMLSTSRLMFLYVIYNREIFSNTMITCILTLATFNLEIKPDTHPGVEEWRLL